MAKHFLHRNGWILLYVALSFLLYSHNVAKKKEEISMLGEHLAALQMERETLLQEREDLLLQINSHSDPDWIKLTLMKGLGLVPEGQLKVYFSNE